MTTLVFLTMKGGMLDIVLREEFPIVVILDQALMQGYHGNKSVDMF